MCFRMSKRSSSPPDANIRPAGAEFNSYWKNVEPGALPATLEGRTSARFVIIILEGKEAEEVGMIKDRESGCRECDG